MGSEVGKETGTEESEMAIRSFFKSQIGVPGTPVGRRPVFSVSSKIFHQSPFS